MEDSCNMHCRWYSECVCAPVQACEFCQSFHGRMTEERREKGRQGRNKKQLYTFGPGDGSPLRLTGAKRTQPVQLNKYDRVRQKNKVARLPPPTSCSDLRSFPCSSPSPLLSTCHLLLCSVTGLEKAELYTIHRCVLSVSAASISKVN